MGSPRRILLGRECCGQILCPCLPRGKTPETITMDWSGFPVGDYVANFSFITNEAIEEFELLNRTIVYDERAWGVFENPCEWFSQLFTGPLVSYDAFPSGDPATSDQWRSVLRLQCNDPENPTANVKMELLVDGGSDEGFERLFWSGATPQPDDLTDFYCGGIATGTFAYEYTTTSPTVVHSVDATVTTGPCV